MKVALQKQCAEAAKSADERENSPDITQTGTDDPHPSRADIKESMIRNRVFIEGEISNRGNTDNDTVSLK